MKVGETFKGCHTAQTNNSDNQSKKGSKEQESIQSSTTPHGKVTKTSHRGYQGKGILVGGQWLSGRVLDSRPKGRGFEPHWHHCFVSLSKNINPSLVLVQHRKTRPFITERLLMGRKESKQAIKQRNNRR